MRHTISDIEQKECEQQDPELQQNLRGMAEVNKNILEGIRMQFENPKSVLEDLTARIIAIRDSL